MINLHLQGEIDGATLTETKKRHGGVWREKSLSGGMKAMVSDFGENLTVN